MDLPAPLTRDVGPLPVWAWLVAGALGIGAGIMLRRRTGTNSAGGSGAVGVDGGVAYPVGSVGGAVTLPNYATSSDTATSTTDDGFQSNHEWRAAALRILIARGFDPYTADQALAGYLDGRAPTADTAEAIDIALSEVGLPPSAPTIVPAGTPAAPATDTAGDGETDIYAGDRLASIVREAYSDNLGRLPDPEGLAFWRDRLASGEISVSDFRRQFAAEADRELADIR